MFVFYWVKKWFRSFDEIRESCEPYPPLSEAGAFHTIPDAYRALGSIRREQAERHNGEGELVLKDSSQGQTLVDGPWPVLVSLLLLMFLPLLSLAQSVTLPKEIKVPVGRLASVRIDWDGEDVKWVIPSALDAFREYDPDPKVIRLRLIGYTQGSHDLQAIAAKCIEGKARISDPAICTVIVGEGPTPPPPVPPPIPPPTPVDPFVKSLRDAFQQETDSQRTTQLLALAGVYRMAARLADDPKHTNWGQLYLAISQFAAGQGVSGKIQKVQVIINTRLMLELPSSSSVPLDGVGRQKAVNSFNAVAVALDMVNVATMGGFKP